MPLPGEVVLPRHPAANPSAHSPVPGNSSPLSVPDVDSSALRRGAASGARIGLVTSTNVASMESVSQASEVRHRLGGSMPRSIARGQLVAVCSQASGPGSGFRFPRPIPEEIRCLWAPGFHGGQAAPPVGGVQEGWLHPSVGPAGGDLSADVGRHPSRNRLANPECRAFRRPIP